MKQSMLTTVDNPFNPFEDYAAWDSFDRMQGYNSAAYLARIAMTSDELTEEENHEAIELAIDEILRENILGIYKKISKDG